MTKLTDIDEFFESWAPRWTAWERDNVGIQVGRQSHEVRRILVALDATEEIIDEAQRLKADTIVTHHPLLFRPPTSLSDKDSVGRLLLSLAEKNIALYSAHTNLDSATDGVSFTLARLVGVSRPRFLMPIKDTLVKIAVFVPESHVAPVMKAMSDAGAGIIGEYTSCSFQLKGKGTFRGSSSSQPFSGKPVQQEEVEEVRLEMAMPRARLDAVIAGMKDAHPYEEVAYDVYTLENRNANFGMGTIGTLSKPVTLATFLARAKKALGAKVIRYTGDVKKNIRTVAVCGGAGSELLETAIGARADVLLTADVRYHAFQSATGRIALIDAGHWETEQVIIPVIVKKLEAWARSRNEKLVISATKHITNPVHSL